MRLTIRKINNIKYQKRELSRSVSNGTNKIIRKRNKLGQFSKVSPWTNILFIKKATSVLLMTLLLVGFLGIKETKSYYNDTEISSGNSFSTGFLDFILTNNNLEKVIGPEALGEVSHASVAMPVDGSLPMQYDVSTHVDNLTSDATFCTALIVEAKLNGISKYIGPLPGLTNAVTTTFGSWEFRFDLPPDASILNNVKCNASVLFSAWRADIVNKADSSWHDEETLNISLTSRMVVLNEIYARPNSAIAPKDREYIELYNNSNAPVDVLGWQISEIAGTTETFYPVVASGAVAGQVEPYNGVSTIIPSGGWLVLEFGGGSSHLNDTGDTVKLYDSATTLLDSHTYSAIPAGKVMLRFPDGIGFWVDPEATPGTENMVSMEDLKTAGFDEETIAEILKLAELKNITLLSDEEKVVPEPVVPEVVATSSQAGATLPEETPPASPVEEVVETENVAPETIKDVPPVTEPEEIVTEKTDVVETTPVISELAQTTEEVIETPIITEPIVEEPTVENVVEAQVIEEAHVAEEAPAVEAVASELVTSNE